MLPKLHQTAQQPEQNMLSWSQHTVVTVIVQLVVDLDSMTVWSQ